MHIREAKDEDKQKWNQFVAENETGSFMQSWEWGDFRHSLNEKIWRFVVEDGEQWLGVIFFYKIPVKLGQSVFDCPKGPAVDESRFVEVLELITMTIDKIAKQESVMSLQIDPNSNSHKWQKLLDEFGFDKAESDAQPRHTLILDIRKDEAELLSQMHEKTRYNIRLAEKKGVSVVVDDGRFKEFYELLKKTMDRQKINMFSENYFKKILAVPFVKLYLAEYQGQVIAANIMIFWNNVATYLFGASDYEYRNIMAPYLLQWKAIQKAKAENIWFYDFWGAAPKDAVGREENWSGFTRFKMGFSPNAELTEYIGTYEKDYSPVKIGLYKFLQKIYRKRK